MAEDPSSSRTLTTSDAQAARSERYSSLEEAAPGAVIHLDANGEVRSPSRIRVTQMMSYGYYGAMLTSLTVLYGVWFGPLGAATGLGVSALFGWHLTRARRINHAFSLTSLGRLEEAEMILSSIRYSPMCPRQLKATCEQNLGRLAMLRGNYEEALLRERAALRLLAGPRRLATMRQIVEYMEMITLVNLGRVGEARQRLEQKHELVPTGNYLRLQHWTVELFICFAEGRHRIDAEELYQRARVGLSINSAAPLLALTAWAHLQIGDTDQAWHLLREAVERRADLDMERIWPSLHAWMETHLAEASASAPDSAC